DKVKQRLQPQVPISLPGINEDNKTLKTKNACTQQQAINKTSGGIGSNCNDSGNSEYMVKTSQEGLKLTINKTSSSTTTSKLSSSLTSSSSSSCSSTFPSSTSSSSSKSVLKSKQGLGSPSSYHGSSSLALNKKIHTGLKPGVSSGPASKKPSSPTLYKSSSSSSLGSSSKHMFQKSYSSGSLSTKLGSGSSNSSSSAYGLSKSHSTNSFGEYRSRTSKKSHSASTSPALQTPYTSSTNSQSQPASRLDHQADMLKILQYASPTMAASMEGFMKGLNSKFQIPKLSQRNSNSASGSSTNNNTSSTASTSTTSTTTTTIIAINPSDKKLPSCPTTQNQPAHSKHHTQSSISTLSTNVNQGTPTSSSSSLSSSKSVPAFESSAPSKSTSLDFLNTATKSSVNPTHIGDDAMRGTSAATTAPPSLTSK
uniref:Uncharacterized protein n=1 Tax=Stomoxys calcitrans TaxID=35570 RepID=A0A1I8Q188_STOCA